MKSTSRDDIRALLKTFGIRADEAIIKHLVQAPGKAPLQIRLVLEDLTDYGEHSPEEPLHLEVTGEVKR